MKLQNWSVPISLFKIDTEKLDLEELRREVQIQNQIHRQGFEIWQRAPEGNIFKSEKPGILKLKKVFVDAVSDFSFPHKMKVESLIGSEIIRYHGQEISEHTDREDGHVTAHLFLDGPEISGELTAEFFKNEINSYCENAMVIANPATRAREMRLPWEFPHSFYIKPHKGLMVVFMSRMPHYQRPYLGDASFIQVSMTAKFRTLEGLKWDMES
jgi:hypothetical protein